MDFFILNCRFLLFLVIGVCASYEDIQFFRVRKALTNYALLIIPLTAVLDSLGIYLVMYSLYCSSIGIVYMAIVSYLCKKITKKTFGYADIKFAGIIASFFGFTNFLKILFFALFFCIPYLFYVVKNKSQYTIPFIPPLMFGSFLMFLHYFL